MYSCKTDFLKTSYWGSGTAIKTAITKYGRSSFTRGVIEEFETRQQALDFEAKIVNPTYVSDRENYNLIAGGGNVSQVPKGGALTKSVVKYGKDNVSYRTPPWERIEMTADTLQVWERFPEIHKLWINEDEPERRKLATLYQRGTTPFSFHPVLDNMVRLFKNKDRCALMMVKYGQWKERNFEIGDKI